ncbi:hypothetical protein BDV40DRAFT_302286 [Aspergillus tamarii]|uniref:Uncharacterized protein n=1 Tax=Aspergillus tamarii TaxID=41984 RepID=A0A5N6UPB1_ASPTM|nr:hypothetical protein BDV40DRAFT_302286 [Aspergillus tamarii]
MVSSVSSINSLGVPLQPLQIISTDVTPAQSHRGTNEPDHQSLLPESQTFGGESLKSNSNAEDKPKAVLQKTRLLALYLFLLFHFIPLGVSLALIVLNSKTYFYSTDASMLTLLQFVSKVHEVLMQGSIAMTMVAYVQYLLIHESAIPFGAIFTTFRVSQLSVLWSSELWAALTTKKFKGRLFLGFVLLVPFVILLASTVGPSSAIAMLPRQTIYRLPSWELGSNLTYTSIFPESLINAGPPLSSTSATRNELSLAAGWEYLPNLHAVSNNKQIETGLQPKSVNLGDHTGRTIWVMPELYSTPLPTATPWWENWPGLTQIVRTLYVQYAPNSTFATVQHIPVALSLSKAAAHFGSLFKDEPMVVNTTTECPQPYVSTICQLNTILDENDTRPIQFPATYIAGCGDRCQITTKNWVKLTNYTRTRRHDLWDEAKRDPKGRMIWVDDIPLSDSTGGYGLGVIVVQPEMCNAGKTFLTTSACTIGARWGNTTYSVQTTSNGLNSALTNIESKLFPTSLLSVPQWSDPSIKISLEWAKSLNQVTSVQNRSVADNLLRSLSVTDNLCPWNATYGLDTQGYSRTRPYMHEALISSLVANGISHSAGAAEEWRKHRIGGSQIWEYNAFPSGNLEQTISPPAMILKFQGSVEGYAWSVDGVPVKLAIVVLSLYCLYTAVYVLYTILTGHCSMAWSSMAELVILSLNSTPTPAMNNGREQLEHWKACKELITVREVQKNHRLEMVLPEYEQDRGPTRRVAWSIAS